MSAAAAALHSDHVNLLIFRYLQEVGFENTATALHSDWHRSRDCYDPENLPFAREVQRNELVSVIQAGLFHDELQSRIRKGERKFRWTGIDARESIERHDDRLENGAGARPSSSGKPKGRPPVMRRPNNFPTPVPKRQRRSEGSEGQVNGERDPMDVDAASGSGDAEDDGEAASPAVQSDPEQAEVIERYDSMDVATQTEIKTGPKTSTVHWTVDKPVIQSAWNPDSNPNNAKALLTVGESLCRFYDVPASVDDAQQITHVDEPSMPDNAIVTAVAWRPDGQGACCAVSSLRELPDGSKLDSQLLIEHNKNGGSASFQLGPPLLEPPGIVLSLRYSLDSQYLLVARSNMKRGLVQIWKSPRQGVDDDSSTREPIAWRMFDHPLEDVSWTGNDAFVVCGDDGLSAMYQVDVSQKEEMNTVSEGSTAMRGLISHNSKILDTNYRLDKFRFDRRRKNAVFVSSEAKKMIVTPRLYDSEAKPEVDVELDLPEEPVAVDFRPWTKTEDETSNEHESPSLLAVGFGDGTCSIYSITRSPDVGAKCIELASLSLSEGPALSIAWSPNGEHLAVGNGELVQMWSADSLRRKNGVRHVAEASVTWRPISETNGVVDGQHEEKPVAEPSLSWSSDGESLAFTVEKQVCSNFVK
ncbi:hypothetical protein M409DRAFT_49552 [Zasmidium cellare ATCC 36951]|uniref:LisH domain-containing protein n=1 Tax=Zasmidium cellare ATCC 36951 TaxID=1080233 RepID=A0A6A6D0U8_ZASCE|nr:uncharacterized protein M409DRAFT_49552 [Zasmidium cellare ATCC 36951]KAF2173054.1 hypothetical protein M409DRAFT_49552 [Zasmidium cellare ATCC 36951]